jgi:alpha/beta superfamily hydrolase
MFIIGMLLTGSSFSKVPGDNVQTYLSHLHAAHSHDTVVLIHGLMRSPRSMRSLKIWLERQGYQVFSYHYPSAKYKIQDHGMYLNHYIKQLMVQNPKVKIHFITHSLGGIIAREAIAKLAQNDVKRVGSLIMLSPPNQGSVLAKLVTKMLPMIGSSIKPLAELSSDPTSYVHQVPVPKIKMGIIAGRFDAKVPPSSAYLTGQTDMVVVNTNHMFILNNYNVRNYIQRFLETGTFSEEVAFN